MRAVTATPTSRRPRTRRPEARPITAKGCHPPSATNKPTRKNCVGEEVADEQPIGGIGIATPILFIKVSLLKFYFEDATERKSHTLKDWSIGKAHDEAPNLRTAGTHKSQEIHETGGSKSIVQVPKAND